MALQTEGERSHCQRVRACRRRHIDLQGRGKERREGERRREREGGIDIMYIKPHTHASLALEFTRCVFAQFLFGKLGGTGYMHCTGAISGLCNSSGHNIIV